MNKKFKLVRYFYLAMLVFLCAFMGFITVTPSIATGESQAATPAARTISTSWRQYPSPPVYL